MGQAISICVGAAVGFRRSYKPPAWWVVWVTIRLFEDINVYRMQSIFGFMVVEVSKYWRNVSVGKIEEVL